MKKIICLMLALTLVFGCTVMLSSCEKLKELDKFGIFGDDNPGAEAYTVDQIIEIAQSSAATKIVTLVDYKEASGAEFGGEYSMELSGNDSVFTYKYSRYRTIEEAVLENSTERIKVVEGVLYHKDGLDSVNGDEWEASAPVAVIFDFNLAKDKLTGAKVGEDGSTLVATLTSENAKAVLGTDLNAEGEISLTVTILGGRLAGVSVSCTTKSGATMSVRTSYSYNPLTLVFPEA